jgi:hypothetical protein
MAGAFPHLSWTDTMRQWAYSREFRISASDQLCRVVAVGPDLPAPEPEETSVLQEGIDSAVVLPLCNEIHRVLCNVQALRLDGLDVR